MPELRKDPVLGKWVVLSEARAKRPSDFKDSSPSAQPKNGPCPFCQGHEHETGAELFALREGSLIPDWRVRVVKNIYPAVSMESSDGFDDSVSKEEEVSSPFHGCKVPAMGSHEVVIETPHHSVKFTSLSLKNVEEILSCFRHRMCQLREESRFKYIQVFKNQGKAAGASMEHSHSQIIALPIIPHQIQLEIENTRTYFERKRRCILCEILKHDIEDGSRLIDITTDYAVLAPYAPKYPYETWIIPRVHASNFENINDVQMQSLACTLLSTLKKIECLFDDVPFNYMLHSSPVQEYRDVPFYHWTIRIIPHLASLGGFELGSGCHIVPVYPEKSALQLREIKLEYPA
ncbi:hypothetical protein KP509_22G062600 [Ceratopteris richardii]|uniref:UDP-glucose--hexose-1-phosphate uridylyltransferase n=1 Tax=Ceratopteris richardii TaxID=49495 RepID=A0A8T2S8N4_CERRI|nr:hypothetical protein KP509_22G062600 [Ceratopteris richardii]